MKNLKDILIFFIHLYQIKMPIFIRAQCRYNPSCSEYAILAIKEHGSIVGLFLAFFRIIRCIPPFGGFDPPPAKKG